MFFKISLKNTERNAKAYFAFPRKSYDPSVKRLLFKVKKKKKKYSHIPFNFLSAVYVRSNLHLHIRTLYTPQLLQYLRTSYYTFNC